MLCLRLHQLFEARLALLILVGYFLGLFFDPVDGVSSSIEIFVNYCNTLRYISAESVLDCSYSCSTGSIWFISRHRRQERVAYIIRRYYEEDEIFENNTKQKVVGSEKVFTEPLPSNDRTAQRQTHRLSFYTIRTEQKTTRPAN
jgi:hypothetical protein